MPYKQNGLDAAELASRDAIFTMAPKLRGKWAAGVVISLWQQLRWMIDPCVTAVS